MLMLLCYLHTQTNLLGTSLDSAYNEYRLNDLFPIESHDTLQGFELKIQKNENNF